METLKISNLGGGYKSEPTQKLNPDQSRTVEMEKGICDIKELLIKLFDASTDCEDDRIAVTNYIEYIEKEAQNQTIGDTSDNPALKELNAIQVRAQELMNGCPSAELKEDLLKRIEKSSYDAEMIILMFFGRGELDRIKT